MEYRQGSHTRYKIEYHFVWVQEFKDRKMFKVDDAKSRSEK